MRNKYWSQQKTELNCYVYQWQFQPKAHLPLKWNQKNFPVSESVINQKTDSSLFNLNLVQQKKKDGKCLIYYPISPLSSGVDCPQPWALVHSLFVYVSSERERGITALSAQLHAPSATGSTASIWLVAARSELQRKHGCPPEKQWLLIIIIDLRV